MAQHDPQTSGSMDAIEYELEEGRAFALGQAGKRLEAALAAFEADRTSGSLHEELLADAAEAAWGYMIMREIAGFHDHEYAFAIFRVPAVVRARIGVIRPVTSS
ncbi:MAG TPA: DUF6665 family protein [Kofleriaceae bacterium]